MNYIKELAEAGITTASDGVLKEFIARNNYKGALVVIPAAMERREDEIHFLNSLYKCLKEEIDADVTVTK